MPLPPPRRRSRSRSSANGGSCPGCTKEEGPDVYELKFESTTRAPTIRGLKPLFEEARITLQDDLWYEGETEIVEDEDMGYAVALNWTNIATRPRREAESQAAAGRQPSA
ncbi:MAG: hypothetical protein ACOY93_10860 [Bacillota bacterium]